MRKEKEKDNHSMAPGNTVTRPGISLTHEQRTRIKSLVDSNRLSEAQEIIAGILDKIEETETTKYEEGLRV